MEKLIQGIADFRRHKRDSYKDLFNRLASGQNPEALFIACSDSRVVPNLFVSADPGDLFVLRNIGNLVPCCQNSSEPGPGESTLAVIEYAVLNLNIADIVICGHSGCGAMGALLDGREKMDAPHLREWLKHGDDSLVRLAEDQTEGWSPVNKLSQCNVLQQLEHLKSYPFVKERLDNGKLTAHGWWFEVGTANVYAYDFESQKFVLLDEQRATKLLTSNSKHQS